MPETEADLLRQCRQLVDHAEDEIHIALMLKSFPGGWTLEQHVRSLWSLRDIHNQIFRDVVLGIHGRAMATFKSERPEGLDSEAFRAVLTRHGLLLAAMDSQIAIVGARVVTEAPFGAFLDRSGQIVGGTVLRLMKELLDPIEEAECKYQTLDRIGSGGRVRQKLRKGPSKIIAHQLTAPEGPLAKLRFPFRGNSKTLRRSLDARSRLASGKVFGEALIDGSAHYNLCNGLEKPRSNNSLRSFHQIWFSDLSPTTAAAVSLLRFAIAEQALETMTAHAFARDPSPQTPGLAALPPPPSGLDRQSHLIVRVLDLLDSARRAQLKDPRYKSRTPENERNQPLRDPDDMAGLQAVMAACEFLRAAGQRQSPFNYLSGQEGEIQKTYYHLDVVPDMRLNLIGEPDMSFCR